MGSSPDPGVPTYRRLAYIHQTLELIAFLLSVALVTLGGIAQLVGALGVAVLVVNVASRFHNGEIVN